MMPMKQILIEHTDSVKRGKSPLTSDFLSFIKAMKIATFPFNTKSLLRDIRASIDRILLDKKNNAGMM